MVGTHTDIEQQKQLESLLQEQQLHLSEAQRIASMGSWSFDPNSGHFWWSPELRSLLALSTAPCPASGAG